jgi:iron(III) transport system ATP-binding protein
MKLYLCKKKTMLYVKQISFAYEEQETLHEISFSIEKGSHVSVIGESGCGKSTLLKAVYGLIDLHSGDIFWDKDQILGPAYHLIPGHHQMKYLPQEFELMPYISVRQNIEKFLSRQKAAYNQERVDELLQVIDMQAFADTHVKKLSGGQKQRVALAQVLAKEPQFLLLDEPFNFIDNFRKNKLRRDLFNFLKKKQITCLFATHDSKDMLGFSDQVLVMREGKLIAKDTPQQLYQSPPNAYVASLFDEVNVLDTTLFKKGLENQSVLLYPHELQRSAQGQLEVQIEQSYFNGSTYMIIAKAEKNEQQILFHHPKAISAGTRISLQVDEELLKRRMES